MKMTTHDGVVLKSHRERHVKKKVKSIIFKTNPNMTFCNEYMNHHHHHHHPRCVCIHIYIYI